MSLMSLKSRCCSAGPGRRPGTIPFSDSATGARRDATMGFYVLDTQAGRQAVVRAVRRALGFSTTRVRICWRRRARRPRRTRRGDPQSLLRNNASDAAHGGSGLREKQ